MLTLERAAADHDILATVATADLPALSRYTLDLLPRIPGVTAVRARIVTHLFTEGGRWRIAALDPGQRTRLTAPPAARPPRRGHREITAFDRAVLSRLAHDGRASYQSLATGLGVSLSTVRRRIEQLVRLDLLRFRCDFARPSAAGPSPSPSGRRSADRPPRGRPRPRPRPETRNCAAITGPCNLVLQVASTPWPTCRAWRPDWPTPTRAWTSSTASSPCATTSSSATSSTPTAAPPESSRPTSGPSRASESAARRGEFGLAPDRGLPLRRSPTRG
ncbi:AsnC family transcriptional regulator [Streptomyces nogalater]